MGRVIGIDLGTTYSLAAVMEEDGPRILASAEGSNLIPSVVALLPERPPLVGQSAKLQAAVNPEETIFSIKRHMGSDYRAEGLRPEDISGMILRKVKLDAEARLGERVEGAVITVPAYFNDAQRKATREAGRLAGLEVLRLLNEPTAAALAYGLHEEGNQTILVWDLGGGTFDVSILELGDGFFQVKAVGGDLHLGGDDYDLRLADFLADEFRKERGWDIRQDKGAWQRLKEAAENAKIAFSGSPRVRIRLPLLERKGCLERELERSEFETLTRDLTRRMIGPTRQALADAGLSPREIDHVLLVGGSTRLSAVRRLARELLGQEPLPHTVNPDEAVALGAAVQAGILSGCVEGVVLLDVTPLSLGIETLGGICTPLIERNTTLPASRNRIFTSAQDGQTSAEIHVLQGERPLAKDNLSLGCFQLTGLEPQPRGEARIEVTFEIDVDGIVHVSATDLQTEKKQTVQLASLESPSEGEIQRRIQEAQVHADQDRLKREELEAGVRADSMIHAAEIAVHEIVEEGELHPDLNALLDECERAKLALKGALASGDAQKIQARTRFLESQIRTLRRKVSMAP